MNENQNNNQVVTPINEVRIETESTIIKENNIQNNNTSSNKPSKSSKFSTFLLILLFVFLFSFVMGMPYIDEYIKKLQDDGELSEIEKEAIEEEKRQEAENNKPTPTPEIEKAIEVICTLPANTIGNYNLVQIQKFTYNLKNQVISSKSISKYNFTVIDDTYNNLKKQCEEDSLKYLTHNGYTVACSSDQFNIEISHEFDLEVFTPIVDGTTNIQANATYKQDINVLKNSLISQGYTCQ